MREISEILYVLADAEEDVLNSRVGASQDSFDNLRERLIESRRQIERGLVIEKSMTELEEME